MGRRERRRQEEKKRLQEIQKAQGSGGQISSPVIAIEEEVVDEDDITFAPRAETPGQAEEIEVLEAEVLAETSKPEEPAKELKPARLEPERLFRLNVAPAYGTSAVLQFTWCLAPKALEILQAKGIRHPFILVSTFAKKDDPSGVTTLEPEDRLLLPLDRGMGQFEFTRPGEYKICASIVWSYNDYEGKFFAADNLFRFFMRRGNNGELLISLTDTRSYTADAFQSQSLNHHEQIDMHVDQSFFAEKPKSQWLWWWTNLWHNAPRNQCIWRRRAILAFTLKPFLALIYIPLIFVLRFFFITIGFLVGYRHISLKPLLHPFAMSSDDLFPSPHKEIFGACEFFAITKKDGTKRALIWQILLMPIAWVLAILVAILGYNDGNLLLAKFAIPTFIGLAILIAVGVWLVKSVIRRNKAKLAKGTDPAGVAVQWEEVKRRCEEEKARKKEEERRQAIAAFYTRRLEPLSCVAGGPRVASYEALPKTHRTVWLYFADLKAKVCKPFAQ